MNIDFISKLSEGGKKIFYLTVLVVGLALVDRLFLGPVLERLKTIDEEIMQQEENTRRDLRFLTYKDKILQNSQSFSKYFTKGKKDDDVINAEFLSTIEKLATQSKVNLVKSNPSEAKKEKMFAQYFANLDCNGQLKDVVTFMHMINAHDELLKITRLNMTPKKGAEGEVNASMTVAKMIINPDIFDEKLVPSK